MPRRRYTPGDPDRKLLLAMAQKMVAGRYRRPQAAA